MTYSLTVAGYEFDNPPEGYRKHIMLGNTPVPHFKRPLAKFYQSGHQELQFEVNGTLSLNEQADLDELSRLQALATDGGEVTVDFDPFFSGECIIEDDPFRQQSEEGRYRFIMTVNSESTDATAYPPHATPTTGNSFGLGTHDLGYDPDSVEENYERQTTTVDRLQGISQSTDTAGLVTHVTLSGNTDGGGQAQLWDKARNNILAQLSAEFQSGWALITDLSISNHEGAPHYLKGLFQYDLDLLIVSNPDAGIGEVSSYIDHGVKRTGTYVADSEAGRAEYQTLTFYVGSGTGSLDGDYIRWDRTEVTLPGSDTTFIGVEDPDGDGSGTVVGSQSAFPSPGIDLFRVVTDNSEIQRIEDLRSTLVNDNDHDAADAKSASTDGQIWFIVFEGRSPDDPNGQPTTWPQTTLQLAPNATNYVYLEDPDTDGDGRVGLNQSGYPSGAVPFWTVTTDGEGVTSRTDDRPGDLTEPGSGDVSDSDLVFSSSLAVADAEPSYQRVLAPADEDLSVADSAPAFTSLVAFSDSVALSDGDPTFTLL